jgi:hypothetical protein
MRSPVSFTLTKLGFFYFSWAISPLPQIQETETQETGTLRNRVSFNNLSHPTKAIIETRFLTPHQPAPETGNQETGFLQ